MGLFEDQEKLAQFRGAFQQATQKFTHTDAFKLEVQSVLAKVSVDNVDATINQLTQILTDYPAKAEKVITDDMYKNMPNVGLPAADNVHAAYKIFTQPMLKALQG